MSHGGMGGLGTRVTLHAERLRNPPGLPLDSACTGGAPELKDPLPPTLGQGRSGSRHPVLSPRSPHRDSKWITWDEFQVQPAFGSSGLGHCASRSVQCVFCVGKRRAEGAPVARGGCKVPVTAKKWGDPRSKCAGSRTPRALKRGCHSLCGAPGPPLINLWSLLTAFHVPATARLGHGM